VLDLGCVVVGISVDWLLPLLSFTTNSSGARMVSKTSMFLKMLRLLRLIRAVRLIHMVPELGALSKGLIASVRTVASACALLLLALYTLACLGFEAITTSEALLSNHVSRAIVEQRFSSLPRTILTLMSFTNGDSLAGMYEPLVDTWPPIGLFFGAAWIVVTVSLMNLVTAVIVNTAIEQHKQDEHVQRKRLRKRVQALIPLVEELFDRLDANDDGVIEVGELQCSEWDEQVEVPAKLRSAISIEKLRDLFVLLDADGSTTLEKGEFVLGVMHLMFDNVPIETTQILQILHSQSEQLEHLHQSVSALTKDFAERDGPSQI
jgi:hypothetical protein